MQLWSCGVVRIYISSSLSFPFCLIMSLEINQALPFTKSVSIQEHFLRHGIARCSIEWCSAHLHFQLPLPPKNSPSWLE